MRFASAGRPQAAPARRARTPLSFRVLALAMACLLALPMAASAAGLRLNKKKLSLRVGNVARIQIRSMPQGTRDELTIQSTNPNIADAYIENGVPYAAAKAVGQVMLTLWKGDAAASLEVTVLPPLAQSAAMSQDGLTLCVGESAYLRAAAYPEQAAQTFKWRSSKARVTSVGATGLVRAKNVGTALITAKTSNGVKCVCRVEVVPKGQKRKRVVRILSIANQDYDGTESDLSASVVSMRALTQAIKDNPPDNLQVARHSEYRDQTDEQMLSLLNDLSGWGIGDEDITIFLYSGHGSYRGAYGNSYLCGTDFHYAVSVDRVQQALDRLPGQVYVVLDCCFSGGFIGKGASSGPKAFNAGVMRAFSGATAKTLTGSNYHVLTAAAGNQVGYGFTGTINGQPFAISLLNYFLAYGGGLDQLTGVVPGGFPADTDGDAAVSFWEAYHYTKRETAQFILDYNDQKGYAPGDEDYVIVPDVQVFPENDAAVLFAK